MGVTVVQAIDYWAGRYNLDATAMKIVALGEGGLEWHAGDDGDNGTSFGPFQLHIGGRLPVRYNNDPEGGKAFANSFEGIGYVARKMAELGAAGKTGLDAIRTMIYEFEAPADKPGSFANATRRYEAWQNGRIDFTEYSGTTKPASGTEPSASTSTSPSGWVFPVKGRHSFTDDWGGTRSAGATGGTGKHQGNDIFADEGTPVVAVEDGYITRIGWNTYGGNRLWLNGSFYYAHLSRYEKGIRQGSYVHAGDIIGYVGHTGDARNTPPHLHFGYDPNGTHGQTWENPYSLLTGAGEAPEADPTQLPSKYQGPVASPTELDDGQNSLLFGGPKTPPAITLAPDVPEPQPVGGALEHHPALDRSGKLSEQWKLIASQPLASPEAGQYASMFDGG